MEPEMVIATAVCCREWPVFVGARIGHCGLCGEVPIVKPGSLQVLASRRADVPGQPCLNGSD